MSRVGCLSLGIDSPPFYGPPLCPSDPVLSPTTPVVCLSVWGFGRGGHVLDMSGNFRGGRGEPWLSSPPTTTHSETLTVAAFRPPLRYLTSTCYEAIVSFALVTLLPSHGVVQFDGVLLRAWSVDFCHFYIFPGQLLPFSLDW